MALTQSINREAIFASKHHVDEAYLQEQVNTAFHDYIKAHKDNNVQPQINQFLIKPGWERPIEQQLLIKNIINSFWRGYESAIENLGDTQEISIGDDKEFIVHFDPYQPNKTIPSNYRGNNKENGRIVSNHTLQHSIKWDSDLVAWYCVGTTQYSCYEETEFWSSMIVLSTCGAIYDYEKQEMSEKPAERAVITAKGSVLSSRISSSLNPRVEIVNNFLMTLMKERFGETAIDFLVRDIDPTRHYPKRKDKFKPKEDLEWYINNRANSLTRKLMTNSNKILKAAEDYLS